MLEDPSSDPDRATQRCQARHTQVGHTAAEGTGETGQTLRLHSSSIIGLFSVLELFHGHAKLPSVSDFVGFGCRWRQARPAVWPEGHQSQSGALEDFGGSS